MSKYEQEDYQEEKRKVPPMLKSILNKDIEITGTFKSMTRNNSVFRSIKTHHKLLEYSCHGIAWLACVIASLWIIGSKSYYQVQINLLIALIIDIIVVGFLKAFTRRRRPAPDTSLTSIGPDQFSFPSGHASRAAMVVYIFLNIHPVPYIFVPPLLAWASTVALSRIVADKHYILDIAAGITLGITEGFILSFLWLSQETTLYLAEWLSDEKLSGGEYHV